MIHCYVKLININFPTDVSDSGAAAQLSSLTSVAAQQGAHGKRDKEDDSEFDMFAQSRNVTYESSKSGYVDL